jgi:hypothetical protein
VASKRKPWCVDLGLAGRGMKVLDLQCDAGHVFEGWFGSEQDYQDQLARSLVGCPMCSSASITKKLSAPRLNLRATHSASAQPLTGGEAHEAPEARQDMASPSGAMPAAARVAGGGGMVGGASAPAGSAALQAHVLSAMRELWHATEDVGDQFSDRARAMHYGDAEPKAIRGQASREQALELVEEGIDVLPLLVPESVKSSLQ